MPRLKLSERTVHEQSFNRVALTRGAEHGTLFHGLRRLSSMAAQFQKRNLVICLPYFQKFLAQALVEDAWVRHVQGPVTAQ